MQQKSFWGADSFSASQKCPALYGTRRFTIVFTRARYWFPSWVQMSL